MSEIWHEELKRTIMDQEYQPFLEAGPGRKHYCSSLPYLAGFFFSRGGALSALPRDPHDHGAAFLSVGLFLLSTTLGCCL